MVNPPSREVVYLNTFVKVGSPSYPNITLAVLAAELSNNHEVQILDLDVFPEPLKKLVHYIGEFQPDYVATTAKTPYFNQAIKVMEIVKSAKDKIITMIGGVHPTTFPEETINTPSVDIVVCGEGEDIIREVADGIPLSDIKGIHYKGENGKPVKNSPRDLFDDLDQRPFPVWTGYDLSKYVNSRLSSRKNPCGFFETSRGCPYQCCYCNKNIFGSKIRYKSIERVIEEIKHCLQIGFQELHFIDDSFTQKLDRAKGICEEISKNGLIFPWSLFNGVRVDRVDLEFFQMARKAGCWQVAFGVESGAQNILDGVGKKTKLSQIRQAIGDAKKAGLDTFGFFMLGLLEETEESMEKTIKFSKSLPFDMVKFVIAVPYPGTKFYQELMAQKRIKTTDWSKYLCHGIDEPIFDHPNLSFETISSYYRKAFRDFYLNPSFIFRRFFRSLKMGDLWFDFMYFIRTRW